MRTRTLGVIGVLAIAMTSCGDDGGGTAVTSAPFTGAPPTTAAPTTVAPTTVAPTTAAPTTAAPTTTVAPSTTALPPALPNGELTAPAYRIARSVIGRSMQVTRPAGATYAVWTEGAFVLAADPGATLPLLSVLDLSAFLAIDDPTADVAGMEQSTIDALPKRPTPVDYLAWFAALPGVEAGDATETEFAGLPATAMTWKVASVDGGTPCADRERGNCLVALYLPGFLLTTYFAGDSGITYLLDIDGRPIIVEVQDRPGASDAADSLVIGD